MEEFSKIVEVDGHRYQINHPQVDDAWDIGIELLKLIGGSAAAMAGGSGNQESAAAALSVAVNGILLKLEGKESMRLIKRLLKGVELLGSVDGENKKMLLDDAGIKKHFYGRTGSLMRLAGEVVAFTHTGFFEAVGDGVSSLMKTVSEKMAA